MRKEEKAQIIDQVAAQLSETPNFYVTDISGLPIYRALTRKIQQLSAGHVSKRK